MTLELRKFSRRDIPELLKWFPTARDALQWAGAGMPWPLTTEAINQLIDEHRGASPDREVWAVCSPSGEMIGHAQLRLNRRLQTIALGRIAVAPDRRGTGLGGLLMKRLTHRVFEHDWAHRAELLVYDHNAPAIRVYQSVGFVIEGVRRETTPFENERWNTLMMSLLRYEFDKRT